MATKSTLYSIKSLVPSKRYIRIETETSKARVDDFAHILQGKAPDQKIEKLDAEGKKEVLKEMFWPFPPLEVTAIAGKKDETTTYEIIDGHHRLAAAKRAGYTMLPCNVQKLTPYQAYEQQWSLNDQTAMPLTALERAQVIWTMHNEFKVKQVDLMRRFSYSKSSISRICAKKGQGWGQKPGRGSDKYGHGKGAEGKTGASNAAPTAGNGLFTPTQWRDHLVTICQESEKEKTFAAIAKFLPTQSRQSVVNLQTMVANLSSRLSDLLTIWTEKT